MNEHADERLWRKPVRVAVVIPEVVIRRQVPDPAAETIIFKHLLEAGFKCVEQTSIFKLRDKPQVAAAISATRLIEGLDDDQSTNDGLTAGQRARQTRSDTVVVAVEPSQVRLQASAASATLRRASRGTALKVLDRVAPWIQVQLADGTAGWVHESEVRPLTATPLPPTEQ